MKVSNACLAIIIFCSCASAQTEYTASIPAGSVVREFFNIPAEDSVDFIRVQLKFDGEHYQLDFNYGIGKPNTNGFIDGGKKGTLNGVCKKASHIYQLNYENRYLSLIELNTDLLHILDASNKLLVGNGGWSYTLNNIHPLGTDKINRIAQQTSFKDSMTFEGRTPCNVPDIIPAGMQCYKLKWYIVLYAGIENKTTGAYKILGTAYRKQGAKEGNWKMIKAKNGRVIYKLTDNNGNDFLNFVQPDAHILMFTDAQGKLLVGDEDFSYTLNGIE